MQTLCEVIDNLRSTAEALEQADKRLTAQLIGRDMGLREAFQAVRASVGSSRHISIKCDIDQFDSEGSYSVKWSLYDGKHFHEGRSLSAAINVYLAHRMAREPAVDALVATEAALNVEADQPATV